MVLVFCDALILLPPASLWMAMHSTVYTDRPFLIWVPKNCLGKIAAEYNSMS